MMAGTLLAFVSLLFTAFTPPEVVFRCSRSLSSVNGAFTCCFFFHWSAAFFLPEDVVSLLKRNYSERHVVTVVLHLIGRPRVI